MVKPADLICSSVIPFLDGVLNAIAYDGHHVAVFDDIELVTDAAMAGDDVRAAFFFMLGDGDIDDVVQSVDLALNAAAAFHVDERITIGIEYIAGRDTSERRKITRLSPSVCAAGCQRTSTGSSLKKTSF